MFSPPLIFSALNGVKNSVLNFIKKVGEILDPVIIRLKVAEGPPVGLAEVVLHLI